MTQTLLSASLALAGVLLLIVLAGRVARMTRLGRNPDSGRLRIVESLALDTRRKLVLVSCDGRGLLLLTGAQDQVVGWLADPAS
jgi:flagellar protein FliO/FliZ